MIYTKETYNQLIQLSYGYNLSVQNKSPEWKLMRDLYEKNYIQNTDTTERIPKIIHQIWLGEKPIPKAYLKYMASWKAFHPTWEYKLWTDKDVNDIEIVRRDIFDHANNAGMKSDILRYEILRQIGGLYVDTDFECFKPFDDLLHLAFFTGIGYDVKLQLYIGLLGSVPQHCIMNKCSYTLDTLYDGHKASTIMNVTGVSHFTKCFISGVSKGSEGVVAFPMAYFYPFPNNTKTTENHYRYRRNCSYAIHHWGISWIKSKVNNVGN
mgnify:CR=1 FL=1